MAYYICTFLINQSDQGISESYYYSAGSPAAATNAAFLLANQRVKLLVNAVDFAAIRVSDTAIVGDSYLDTRIRSVQGIDLPGDLTGSGIQCRLQSGGLYRRSLLLRGVPDAWIIRDANGTRTYETDGRTAATAYCAYLRDNQWLLKITKKQTENPGTAFVDATAVAGQPKLTTITSGFGDLLTPPGTKFQITGCRNTARVLNGYWNTVGAVSVVGQVKIGLVFGRIEGFNPADTQKAKVRPVQVDYLGITSGIPINVAYRKPGRAFFVPRGRQPNRPH